MDGEQSLLKHFSLRVAAFPGWPIMNGQGLIIGQHRKREKSEQTKSSFSFFPDHDFVSCRENKRKMSKTLSVKVLTRSANAVVFDPALVRLPRYKDLDS